MEHGFFFGYGSLVNCDTHDFAPVHAGQARGWRRAWRGTQERQIAFLTAVSDPAATIDGLIAPVPPGGWAALDERERAYDRHNATHQIDFADGKADIAIYAIAPDRMRQPTEHHPILLSYLDVVIQGYLRHFGQQGVADFVATTDGWTAPVLDDRAAPIYPRAQRLAAVETQLVDAILADQNSHIIPMESRLGGF